MCNIIYDKKKKKQYNKKTTWEKPCFILICEKYLKKHIKVTARSSVDPCQGTDAR